MCQNGLLTPLFLRCFAYPVRVHFGYTLFRHTARHRVAVVCLVPRRAGVARPEASFVTRLPVAGYTRGAVVSGAPCTGRCCGVRQGTPSGGVRLGCGVYRLRGCRVQGTGVVRLGRWVLPPGYSPGYRVRVQGYRLVGCTCWVSRF